MRKRWWVWIILGVVLGLGLGLIFWLKKNQNIVVNKGISVDKYLDFMSEADQVIKDNYWQKLSDTDLDKIWVAAVNKAANVTLDVGKTSHEAIFKGIDKVITSLSDDSKKNETTSLICDMVLANLQPFSRSRLYTLNDETSLNNAVANKTTTDEYQTLGVDKNASASAVKQAYEIQTKKIASSTAPEDQEKLVQLQKAYQVLSDPVSKQNYDISGVEPTMSYKMIGTDIFYVHMTKFSPTSVDELKRVMDKVKDQPEVLDTLIFDLRDNVGGSIDILPYFLGPFIGYDRYAYQFLHQGMKTDFKTTTDWLASMARYKKVVVLINQNTQSTAEVMASVLKKYNVGVLVGVSTKGWGTVEKVFSLTHQLDPSIHNSVFLVHSLTLREDGQPIEGKGVDPKVNIQKSGWEKELLGYFNSSEILMAVKSILNQK